MQLRSAELTPRSLLACPNAPLSVHAVAAAIICSEIKFMRMLIVLFGRRHECVGRKCRNRNG